MMIEENSWANPETVELKKLEEEWCACWRQMTISTTWVCKMKKGENITVAKAGLVFRGIEERGTLMLQLTPLYVQKNRSIRYSQYYARKSENRIQWIFRQHFYKVKKWKEKYISDLQMSREGMKTSKVHIWTMWCFITLIPKGQDNHDKTWGKNI